jgi:hypothetical protein
VNNLPMMDVYAEYLQTEVPNLALVWEERVMDKTPIPDGMPVAANAQHGRAARSPRSAARGGVCLSFLHVPR